MATFETLNEYEEILHERMQLQQALVESKQEERRILLEYKATLEAKALAAGLSLPPSPTLSSIPEPSAAAPAPPSNTAAAATKKPAVRRRKPTMPEPIPQLRAQKTDETSSNFIVAKDVVSSLESQGIDVSPGEAHESLALLVSLEHALSTGQHKFTEPHRITPDILRIMKVTSGLGWTLHDQIADAIAAAVVPEAFKSDGKKTEAEHAAIIFGTAEHEPFGLGEEDVKDCDWARNLGIDPEAAGYLRFMTEQDDHDGNGESDEDEDESDGDEADRALDERFEEIRRQFMMLLSDARKGAVHENRTH